MKDIFGQEITVGATVAVSRQVGYSVRQYAATVVETYLDKSGHPKVKVKYSGAVRGYGTPERATSVGSDKVVVISV